jgi:hypothetical protein
MAAAFRDDPGLGNLRHTTIEWLTTLPGMRARNVILQTKVQNKQSALRQRCRFDVIYGWKACVPERPI